jgi:hypothetical protein
LVCEKFILSFFLSLSESCLEFPPKKGNTRREWDFYLGS